MSRSQNRPTRGASAPNLDAPSSRWDPLSAHNNLPPISLEELTTPAVETQCGLATEALETLRDATDKLSAPLPLLQTMTLVEAQASSAIEGIVTNVDEMLKHSPGAHPHDLSFHRLAFPHLLAARTAWTGQHGSAGI